MTRLPGFIYQSIPDLEEHLGTELGQSDIDQQFGGLAFRPGPLVKTRWHQNVWLEPFEIQFTSLSDAARQLKKLGAFWSPQPFDFFRKTELIQQKLPHFSTKPKSFPFVLPTTPIGSWAIVDENTLWASPRCSSPFPGGQISFVENKTDPPSSAYLKLWEALTLYGSRPQQGDRCLDAGSAPGGWTWVLAQTGAEVTSIDRAPLNPSLERFSNIKFSRGNAFQLAPNDFGPLDWFFSDVICYPEKLWTWLEPWIVSGQVKHFVVTIKMQGTPDWETIDRFAAVPSSRIIHLHHNKHELTWML